MSIRTRNVAEAKDEQSMSAMIDIVFLLLIFFIVTTGACIKTTLIDTSLPASNAAVSSATARSFVVEVLPPNEGVTTTEAYRVNGIPHSIDQVKATLSQIAGSGSDREIIIRCHPESLHGQLVDVLSQCHANQLHNIRIARPERT